LGKSATTRERPRQDGEEEVVVPEGDEEGSDGDGDGESETPSSAAHLRSASIGGGRLGPGPLVYATLQLRFVFTIPTAIYIFFETADQLL
jgi:hypothetical protein